MRTEGKILLFPRPHARSRLARRHHPERALAVQDPRRRRHLDLASGRPDGHGLCFLRPFVARVVLTVASYRGAFGPPPIVSYCEVMCFANSIHGNIPYANFSPVIFAWQEYQNTGPNVPFDSHSMTVNRRVLQGLGGSWLGSTTQVPTNRVRPLWGAPLPGSSAPPSAGRAGAAREGDGRRRGTLGPQRAQGQRFKSLRFQAAHALQQRRHLRKTNAPIGSHSRESGKPLCNPLKRWCLLTGFLLSRE